jgi:hypothetical protein
MSPVNIAELAPDVQARVLKQIEGTDDGASNPTQIRSDSL